MINTGDHVLIYRTGHLYYTGIAGTVRGFDQKHITINYFNDYINRSFEVDRATGLGASESDFLKAKVVTKEEWDAAVSKHKFEEGEKRLRREEFERKEDAEREALAVTAEAWYNGLPEDQRKMIDALVWKWQGVAVA